MTRTEVDVWKIPLQMEEDAVCHRRLLSHDELQRADRFRFEKPRIRFIAARVAMRQILSRYLGIAPQKLAFYYGPQGKPELHPNQGAEIKFNLSHSRDCGLLAVTAGRRVGVDIQYVDERVPCRDIACHFFSPTEVNTLRNIADDEGAEAFFSCWTRKEAYIKALGQGLSVPLDSFDVTFGPGVLPALLRVEGSTHQSSPWRVYDLNAPIGYKAALVVEGRRHRLRHHSWNSVI